jgi:glycosyltransferase involved in cell wall biosynthesis
MRIAYISLHWPRTHSSGVGNKINLQISEWRKAGHEVEFFMHAHPGAPGEALLSGKHFFYNSHNDLVSKEADRIRALHKLIQALKQYRPDLIYLRFGVYILQLQQLRKIAPLCVEINCNDLIEHKRLGALISTYNRFTRRITLGSADGFLFESGALAGNSSFSGFQAASIVVGNGIDLGQITPLPAPNNSQARLVFVGTPGYYWHGVDKLAALANKFPDLQLDVIGYDSLPGAKPGADNLHFHGYLDRKALREVLSRADAAIGTMAMHRSQKGEGSPLKTLEYLAYGLPVILPYQDTNLKGLKAEFILRIPDSEENIETCSNQIYEFVQRMRGKRVDREVLAPYIDIRSKEKERLAFMEKVARDKKG